LNQALSGAIPEKTPSAHE